MRNNVAAQKIGRCLSTTLRIRAHNDSSSVTHFRHFKNGQHDRSRDTFSIATTAYAVGINRAQYVSIVQQIRRYNDNTVTVDRIRVY